MHLDDKTKQHLLRVHPDLRRVFVELANDPTVEVVIGGKWRITSGLRTLDEQRQLVLKGASRTLRSRHLEGHAVDLAIIVDGKAVWDLPRYALLNERVQAAADLLGVRVRWGGQWKTFVDGPHFELDRLSYPER